MVSIVFIDGDVLDFKEVEEIYYTRNLVYIKNAGIEHAYDIDNIRYFLAN